MAKTVEDTPLLKHYFATKAMNPEAVLLYRVGDFYEAYSDDAILVSKVLGIVLTKRSNGDKGPTEMAGFPHHALDIYLPKLVRSGYKVAVCDQLEDPKLAGGKLVKRGITEIVTPGIAFGEQMLEQKEHNWLAGITFEAGLCGAAFLDASTGSFNVAQGSPDYIGTLLSAYKPKELICQREYNRDIKERFGDYFTTTLDEWAFVKEAAVEKLKKQFCVTSLKGFGVDKVPLGLCSAGALIVYLEQTQHIGLKNICSISRIDEGKYVWMDRFTVNNLELFQSAMGGEGSALIDVIDKCSSPMGARLLRQWLAMPVMELGELEARYNVVGHFTEQPDGLGQVRERIGEIGDLERVLSRAATGKILPKEVARLANSLRQLEPIEKICKGKGVKALDEITAQFVNCDELIERIEFTLDKDTAAQIGKGNVIGGGVDAELDELRSISQGGKQYLDSILKRETERTEISSLKIGYNNVFGYYLEVRNSAKDKVPQEWIRKQTLVNAERYITEELKEYESKILSAEERIYEIESRIYQSLVYAIQDRIREIQSTCLALSRLDVLSGFAALAIERKYCRPEMNDGYAIEIKEGRHPVIETLMKPGEEYVPNDIYIDKDKQQIIILTGPNMAGKSALLRQTALIVLMAQMGSFVPASKASIGYCDKIFTRVGASDNISRGESTFMVEMLETSMIMHNLSSRSLVLLDEIGRGTSTYDGMSIARALVEYLHNSGKGAKTLFATHYHELNDMEEIYPRVKNFHIAVKEEGKQVIFLRKLCEGGVAHSFGIHVARLAGMPKEIVASAERTLKELERNSKSVKAVSKAGALEEDGSIQLSLFQLDDPMLASIRDSLASVDLDNMTPMQAFDLLRRMKQELGI